MPTKWMEKFMMVGSTVQYTLLLRFSPFETKQWRKNCNVTRTLRLDCREESISESGAAEGTGQTHQQGTLSSASNAEVYKRTSEYILRFLMWHYFWFWRIICLRVALHFTSVRQRENFFCRNSWNRVKKPIFFTSYGERDKSLFQQEGGISMSGINFY